MNTSKKTDCQERMRICHVWNYSGDSSSQTMLDNASMKYTSTPTIIPIFCCYTNFVQLFTILSEYRQIEMHKTKQFKATNNKLQYSFYTILLKVTQFTQFCKQTQTNSLFKLQLQNVPGIVKHEELMLLLVLLILIYFDCYIMTFWQEC